MANLKKIITFMNENNEQWQPLSIVEIQLTDEREPGYKSYPHCRIKNEENSKLYMKQDDELIGHYWVWQTTGYLGDDFSGYLLIPLRNNKYLKVSYSC